MPKQKTHKGLSKRVRISATGKLKHKRCCGGHLMSSKSAKRRMRISGSSLLTGKLAAKARVLLGK